MIRYSQAPQIQMKPSHLCMHSCAPPQSHKPVHPCMTSVSQLARISKIVLPCIQAWLPKVPATAQLCSDLLTPSMR